jgi:hypothetical protein
MARIIGRVILLAFVAGGCASVPAELSADQLRAEQIARLYAVDSLGLSKSQVARMKADHNSFSVVDGRETIQFINPKVIHPNRDGFIDVMDGGFPDYFRITVDIRKWQVVDHYASRE